MVEVDTPQGPARLHVSAAADPVAPGARARGRRRRRRRRPRRAGPPAAGRGVTVVRFEQPWHVAGGRVAVRPPLLDAGWRDVLAALPAMRRRRAAAGRRRPEQRRSGGLPHRRRRSGSPGSSASPSRCTRPAGPSRSRLPELLAPRPCRGWCSRASGTPSAPPTELAAELRRRAGTRRSGRPAPRRRPRRRCQGRRRPPPPSCATRSVAVDAAPSSGCPSPTSGISPRRVVLYDMPMLVTPKPRDAVRDRVAGTLVRDDHSRDAPVRHRRHRSRDPGRRLLAGVEPRRSTSTPRRRRSATRGSRPTRWSSWTSCTRPRCG